MNRANVEKVLRCNMSPNQDIVETGARSQRLKKQTKPEERDHATTIFAEKIQ
jgi:hypothetical protein